MHRILERQIKQHLGERTKTLPEWQAFFESVSQTYTHLDEDRALLDRSLDLSSKEFLENNRRLEEAKLKVEKQAQTLAQQVTWRTKELEGRVAELENVRRALSNLLEDFGEEQKKLAEAKAKDEAMLLSIGDGVIIVDITGKITFINQPAQNMLGWKSAEITGKLLCDVIPVEDAQGKLVSAKSHPMSIALAVGTTTIKTFPAVYYYTRKDSTKFPAAITVAPVMLGSKIVGAIEVFRDVTREREIDRAKTEFVSLTSHQLRTPLSTIKWYIEMILAGDAGPLNPEQEKYLNEAYNGTQHMVNLINAFLNVSRLELDTFMITPEPTDLLALIAEVKDELQPLIKMNKLRFVERSAGSLPKLNADPKLLRTVLQNLLTNAVRYTPEAGTVSLDISLLNAGESLDNHPTIRDNVAIVVSDTGYGIPEDQQDKIFTKLFRADNVREKYTEGTGLGLYVTKGIVDHSGGKIWFKSEENKGTTFYVTWPLSGMIKKEGVKPLS